MEAQIGIKSIQLHSKVRHSRSSKQKSHHPIFSRKTNAGSSFIPAIQAIQAKLDVDPVNSPREREADRMADHVVDATGSMPSFGNGSFSAVQTSSDEVVPFSSEKDPDVLVANALPSIPGQESADTGEKDPERDPDEEKKEGSVEAEPKGSVEKPKEDTGNSEGAIAAPPEIGEVTPPEGESKDDISSEDSAAFTGEPSMEPIAEIAVTPELAESIQAKLEDDQSSVDEETVVQRSALSRTATESSSIDSDIRSSKSGGKPLSSDQQASMGSHFQADFSRVRVHTDSNSARLNRKLQSRAFTHSNHIYFNSGQYSPETKGGKHLLAHELTHVVQQGQAIQRKPQIGSSPVKAQRLGVSDALDYFADAAYNIPGYRMFTVILGLNPINMSSVDRSASNIMRALVEFLPGGKLITDALDNHGIFDKASSWFKQQIDTLSITGSSMRSALMEFLDSLGWRDIFRLGNVWRRAKRIFTTPIKRLISFAKGLVSTIMEMVKDAILRPLATLAEGTAAYDLLRLALGEDPITGDVYPRTADNLIGGFMKLIGQEEVWENIKKGNAIERAFAWFQGAMEGLMGFVTSIPGTIISTITSLTWVDIVLIPKAYVKVGKAFLNVASRFIEWAGGTVLQLLEILFSVVAPGAVPWIKKAGAAFSNILRNPIGFVGNLVKAAKNGFMKFVKTIAKHLKKALISWLMGSLAGAGVHIPQSLSIKEILKFVMSVLGVTWEKVRIKLVKHLGEPAVKALETGFELVSLLVTKGPMAMWERIKETLSDVKTMVMGEISSWVVTKVVTKAVTKLVTSLNPAGAVIQAILFIYDTVTFLIDKIKKIATVGFAVLDSIVSIAGGIIQTATNKVEQTLGRILSLAINFFAHFLGLGKISDKVISIVKKIQAKVDAAIDKVVGWIVSKAKAFLKKVVTAGTPEDPQERLDLALDKAVSLVNKLQGSKVSKALISPLLSGLKSRYELVFLKAEIQGGKWTILGKANPEGKKPTDKSAQNSEETLFEAMEAFLATSEEHIPGKAKVKLVSSDVSLNKKIVTGLVDKLTSVSAGARASAIARAHGFIERAGESESSAQIYYLLRQAQRIVNELYEGQAAVLPRNLETHHIDRVAENPTTFEKDRKNRIRSKLTRQITKLPQAEQDRMAAQSESEQREIMKMWVEQTFEIDQENKNDEQLEEISLVIVPMQIHRGAGDTSIHGAERAEKRRQESMYEPDHTFEEFNQE